MTLVRTFVPRPRPFHPTLTRADWKPWCTCKEPSWERVVLFDAITLGCHECATCGKPDRNELGRR